MSRLEVDYVVTLVAGLDLGGEWGRLESACTAAVRAQMPTWSDTQISDYVTDNLPRIEASLRARVFYQREDGEVSTYEIDEESPPYIKGTGIVDRDVMRRLHQIDEIGFENLCADLLVELGSAKAVVTHITRDGGVDFIGYNFVPKRPRMYIPDVAKCCVIGQSKRHALSNKVTENQIRTFIGGALLWCDRLRRRKDVRVLTPVVYAFWTTGTFEHNAKRFARKMGIWHMNGPTLTANIREYGFESEIERYNDRTYRRHK